MKTEEGCCGFTVVSRIWSPSSRLWASLRTQWQSAGAGQRSWEGLLQAKQASWRSTRLWNVLKIASCRFLENIAVLLSPRELVGGKAWFLSCANASVYKQVCSVLQSLCFFTWKMDRGASIEDICYFFLFHVQKKDSIWLPFGFGWAYLSS